MTQPIPLTRGLFAIVDDPDYAWLMQWKWCYAPGKDGKHGYAVRNDYTTGKSVRVIMHRFIVQAEPSMMVDHRDGDDLNNTRSNLRIATRIQNCQNSTGKFNRIGKYKGVYFFNGKHRARICVNKKEIYIGGYTTAEDAARAYNAAAILHFGEFARLNEV